MHLRRGQARQLFPEMCRGSSFEGYILSPTLSLKKSEQACGGLLAGAGSP